MTENGDMGTTNYRDTFIAVAEDCPATDGETPSNNPEKPTIAALQYELLSSRPYELTSDDVLFLVHARRSGIPEEQHGEARERFFAKSQACLRASPLGKRFGWGTHHDSEGRVALVPRGSEEYQRLASSRELHQTAAMRSSRAR